MPDAVATQEPAAPSTANGMAPAASPPPTEAPPRPAEPQVGTDQPGTGATEETQTPPSAAAPKPKFSDLLKDPEFKREADGYYGGHYGERIRQERAAAAAERDHAHQERSVAEQTADLQRKWDAEWGPDGQRAREDARTRELVHGDAYDLQEHTKAVEARRASVDREWDGYRAAQESQSAIAEAEQRARAQTDAEEIASNEALFRSLPREVQERFAGKGYYGTPAQARHAARMDWKAALEAWKDQQHQSEFDTRVDAEVKKRLGKANLESEPLDLATGGAAARGYRSMEELDAEFAKRDTTMTAADYQRLAQGLRYANRRQ